MTDMAHFSNGTQFHDMFQPANCHRDGGCWHDRNYGCPVLAGLLVNGHHPHVLKAPTGYARCTQYLSMTDGQRATQQHTPAQRLAHDLDAHGGGLPLGLPDPQPPAGGRL